MVSNEASVKSTSRTVTGDDARPPLADVRSPGRAGKRGAHAKAPRRTAGNARTASSRPLREATPTPARIRALALAVAVIVAAMVVLLVLEVGRERTGLDVIGHQTAPVVVASNDLYFAFNDMDAQLANTLLVGSDTHLGFTRPQALAIYEQRRHQASQNLQQAAATAVADPAAAASIRKIVDAQGRYEALAAQTMLLDQQANHPAGRPPAAALAKYRQATQLLKSTLLPAAQGLTDRNSLILERTYQAKRSRTFTVRTWIAVVGIALLAALILLQTYLARRFHRLLNPALATATLIAAALVIAGIVLTTDQAEYHRAVKKDAFDSMLALDQARAVSYDANADESRYLVDPALADQYEQAFFAKTQQLLTLKGATLATFDQRFAAALRTYPTSLDDPGWHGYFGVEFRNITFVGERAAAEKTLQKYQIYQVDDRRIRRLTTTGQLRGAIAFCTSYDPGQSNYDFEQYDNALAALIGINQRAFDKSVSEGAHELAGWTVIPVVAGLLILGLLLLGLRGRFAEYH